MGIENINDLLGHPVVGGSWEGFIIENIISSLPISAVFGYYRTTGGAEIDLVIQFNNQELWAIAIKKSTAPKLSRGFHTACDDLNITRKYIIYSGDESYPLGHGVQAVNIHQLIEIINKK